MRHLASKSRNIRLLLDATYGNYGDYGYVYVYVFLNIYLTLDFTHFAQNSARQGGGRVDKPHCYKWALVSGFRCR